MIFCRKTLVLAAFIILGSLKSIAQKKIDSSCKCNMVGMYIGFGSSLPTGIKDSKPTLSGSIGLVYPTQIGAFGVSWNINIFTTNKLVTTTSGQFKGLALYTYSINYANQFPKSKRFFYGASADYNETYSPDVFIYEKEKGIGATIGVGYTFAITKIGNFSIASSYQFAKLKQTDYSNANLSFMYGGALFSWKKKTI